MAITTELVGILGGGKVSTIDINFADPDSGSTHDVVTVPIPSGVPHLVALEMKTMESNSTVRSSCPSIFFNTIDKGIYSTALGPGDAVGVFNSAVTIRAKRNSSGTTNSPAFTGTVYYCPLGA